MNAFLFETKLAPPQIDTAPLTCPDILLLFFLMTAGVVFWGWKSFWKPDEPPTAGEAAAILLAFLAAALDLAGASVFIVFCPRYLLFAAPLALYATGMTWLKGRKNAYWPEVFLIGVISFNLMNQEGQLFPTLGRELWTRYSEQDKLIERSREYLPYHRSTLAAIRLLEEKHPGEPILTTQPFGPLLALPRLGYVKEPLRGYVIGDDPLTSPTLAPPFEADFSHSGQPLLYIAGRFNSPGVYMAPMEPGDEVVFDDQLERPLVIFRKRWLDQPPAGVDAFEWRKQRGWPGRTATEQAIFRASILVCEGKTDEAAKALEGAAMASPRDARLRLEIATWLMAKNRLDLAERYAKEALAIESAPREAEGLLGAIHVRQGRTDEAMRHLAAARDHRTLDCNTATMLAQLHCQKGNHQVALEVVAPFLQQPNVTVGALTVGGLALKNLQRAAEAKALFAAVLEREPASLEARSRLVECHMSLREFEQARREAEALVERHPNDAHAAYLLGFALVSMDRPQESIKSLRRALKTMRDPELMNLLAGVLAADADVTGENQREAVRWASEACVATGHQNAAYLDTLAAAQAGAKELDRAVEIQLRAIEIAKKNETSPAVRAQLERRLKILEQERLSKGTASPSQAKASAP